MIIPTIFLPLDKFFHSKTVITVFVAAILLTETHRDPPIFSPTNNTIQSQNKY